LKNQTTTFISDLGMCCPAEIPTADYNSSGVYGVLPYVAPELLRGDHSKKNPIYILMQFIKLDF